jgi:hypothetical protein
MDHLKLGLPESLDLGMGFEARLEFFGSSTYRGETTVNIGVFGDRDNDLGGITVITKAFHDVDSMAVPYLPALPATLPDNALRMENLTSFPKALSFQKGGSYPSTLPGAISLTFIFWLAKPETPSGTPFNDLATRVLDGKNVIDVRFDAFSKKTVSSEKVGAARPRSIFANAELLCKRSEHFAASKWQLFITHHTSISLNAPKVFKFGSSEVGDIRSEAQQLLPLDSKPENDAIEEYDNWSDSDLSDCEDDGLNDSGMDDDTPLSCTEEHSDIRREGKVIGIPNAAFKT